MSRTKTEIISEMNQTQTLCNRLLMQIGQGHADIDRTKDESLVIEVNAKIEAFQKAEADLRMLENELANS